MGWLSSEVGDGDGFVAVGAGAAGSDSLAPGVAVWAALLAEVSGFTVGALVDGGVLGGENGSGGGVAAAPCGLSAGVGAPLASSVGSERGLALGARYRRGIVTHACHGRCCGVELVSLLAVVGRGFWRLR